MEFTADNESGGFTPGSNPVDLFFLFDASASQDSEITKMVNAAKDIIKMFAPTVDYKIGDPLTDDDKKKKLNMCRVGSALFMGPKLKLMCA